MLQTSFIASCVIYVVLGGVLLKECDFLAKYRAHIWNQYGENIVWFSVALLLNLFAAVFAVLRRLSLEDTGDRLAHLEKQLRGRMTISEELTERILQRK